MKKKDTWNYTKKIKYVENHIKTLLNDSLFMHKKREGNCVALTKIGYDLLTKAGYSVRVAGGKAAFSINRGKWGIVDFGYSPTLDIPGTRAIGHFWLVDDKFEWIIDFTLPFLKDIVHQSDIERFLSAQPFQLPCTTIVPFAKNSPFDTLMRGKIGWHYQEIANRGDDVFLEFIPNIDVYEQ